MKFLTALPDEIIRPFIKFYWRLELDSSDIQHVNRIIPGIESNIIIQFGSPALYKFEGQQWSERKPVSFIEGLFTKPFLLKFTEPAVIFGIRFHSFTLPKLLKVDPCDIKNEFVDTKDLTRFYCDELFERLHNVKDIRTASFIMDKFFLGRIDSNQNINQYIRDIVNKLYSFECQNKLSEFINSFGVCIRKVQLDFKSHTGMTMKHFVNAHRLLRIMKSIRTGSYESLTDLCYTFGYFDQSHMIKDFKSFTGLNPTGYLSEYLPIHTSILLSENL